MLWDLWTYEQTLTGRTVLWMLNRQLPAEHLAEFKTSFWMESTIYCPLKQSFRFKLKSLHVGLIIVSDFGKKETMQVHRDTLKLLVPF